MMWPGKVRVNRSSRVVRLGDFVVPQEISVDLEGDNGHPDMHAHFAIRDGRPGAVEMRVVSKPTGRHVRSADLNVFNLDNFALNIFQSEASLLEDASTGQHSLPGGQLAERDWWEARKVIEDAVKSPGRGSSEAELRRVAEIYMEHEDGGEPRVAVQTIMGFKSKRTAFRRIQQARAAGFFDEAPPPEPRPPAVEHEELKRILRRNAGRDEEV